MSVSVIRFSSLGDVALTAAVTQALGGVHYLTSARYAPLVARFEGVEEVIAMAPGESLASLRARLPPGLPVVDLHGSLRSRALALGRRPRRVDRLDLARRARVMLKRPDRIRPLVQRYAEAAGVAVSPPPWIQVPRAPELLGLAPGAAHATKRWPVARFAALAEAWEGPVAVFGAASERALLEQVAGAKGEVIAEEGFTRTLEGLGRCAVMVSGDSGLMHLAAACGVPVVGVFGPTTSADGFWCHRGEVVELPLPCRPCSRFGGPRCPIGDHLCLQGLAVAPVLAAARRWAA